MSHFVPGSGPPRAHHSSLDRVGLRGLGWGELILFLGNGGGARHLCQSIYHGAQMKLVTICKNWSGMTPEYTPGKCNIGSRGRAIRLSTGAVLIALSVILGVTALTQVVWVVRLALVLPMYAGMLAALEGSTSFCVLHAARGTYDFHEPMGFASNRSKTVNRVGSEDWKKLDRRRALRMHVEALAVAVLLATILALA